LDGWLRLFAIAIFLNFKSMTTEFFVNDEKEREISSSRYPEREVLTLEFMVDMVMLIQ